MKKYVISLEKDSYRRELFFSQSPAEDFHLFPALNTMSESEEMLNKRFNFDRFLQKYGRHVTKGEVGCCLSHLAVYQQIAENPAIQDNEFCLICEDDALFHPAFQQGLSALITQENQADMILIGQSKITGFQHIELEINYPTALLKKLTGTPFSLGYPYRNYYAGTVAYLIRQSAAKQIIQSIQTQKPFWLADDFILFKSQFRLDIQVVRPLMAIENPQLNSNLEAERGAISHSFWQKLIKYPAKKLLAIVRNVRKI